MRSELQIQASRANGARSHGPVTPEGKLASSRNALTHGMLSDTIVLEGESQERFGALLVTLFEEFQPQTPFEETLIEIMAAARWRLMRIWGLEKAGMDYQNRKQAEALSSTGSQSTENSATRTAIAFRTLSDDSRSLDLINRYEARYERQYLRAHRRFLEVRDRRTPPSGQAQPEPAHVNPPTPPDPPQAEPETPVSEKVDPAKGTREHPSAHGKRRGHRRYHRAYATQPRLRLARRPRIRLHSENREQEIHKNAE